MSERSFRCECSYCLLLYFASLFFLFSIFSLLSIYLCIPPISAPPSLLYTLRFALQVQRDRRYVHTFACIYAGKHVHLWGFSSSPPPPPPDVVGLSRHSQRLNASGTPYGRGGSPIGHKRGIYTE